MAPEAGSPELVGKEGTPPSCSGQEEQWGGGGLISVLFKPHPILKLWTSDTCFLSGRTCPQEQEKAAQHPGYHGNH